MNMRRFLICLLSFAALAAPTTSWEASTSQNLAITVTAGQAITAVNLSSNSFAGGTSSGTVIGAISVTMSPASPTFSGSLSLTGTNASQFQITEGNLVTKGVVAAGTYQINIVASEAGVTGSPFTQAETITGTTPATGAQSPGPSAQLFNNPYYSCVRNYYVNAATGSNSNNGGSSSPWATIQHADDVGRAAGDCVNVAPGTYAPVTITRGGNLASATGYVVYRCTTMDACTISGSSGFALSMTQPMPNYLMFDGFTFAGTNVAYGQGVEVFSGNAAGLQTSSHHIWVLNNIIRGMGQSGVQMNDGEYFYVLHNTSYGNSNVTCDAQGSGISFVTLKAFSAYTPTADDSVNPNSLIGTLTPFHNVVAWNVAYNNALTNCGSPSNPYDTDGNGIIMDTFSNGGTLGGIDYPNQTLVAFNVTYNNGGRGVEVFRSSHVTVANNSSYNNNLDTNDNGTERPEIEIQDGASNPAFNNLAYGIAGAGILAYNASYTAGGTGSEATFNTNLSFCSGTPSNGCNPMYSGNTFSCTANKCATNPSWVNVGNISGGSVTTPPAGANFALQSSSPAVGYGQTKSYLPAQSIDAGACYRTLTTCP
jgi:hypothetical protein